MDVSRMRATLRQRVEIRARMLVIRQGVLQVAVIVFLLEQRHDGGQSRLDLAQQSQFEGTPIA